MSVDSELAWAAGFFDGEGCVVYYLQKGGKQAGRLQYWLSVSNCDRRGLDEMQDLFGGRVRVARKVDEQRRYACGIWEVTGSQAIEAAKQLAPHSILKREQLELLIEAHERTVGSRGVRITSRQHRLRQRYSYKIKRLKRPQWEGVS